MVNHLFKEEIQLKKYIGLNNDNETLHASATIIKGRSTVNKGYVQEDGRVSVGFTDIIYTSNKIEIYDKLNDKTVKKVLEIKDLKNVVRFYTCYVE